MMSFAVFCLRVVVQRSNSTRCAPGRRVGRFAHAAGVANQMIIALAGCIAGAAHVLTGPDHLAAIAPLALQRKNRLWNIGFRWGLGHSLGVGLIGFVFLFLRELLPMALITSVSERLVGVVLVGIGLWTLRKALSTRLHTHEHRHGASSHVHVHLHSGATPDHDHGAHAHSHAALGIGALHGLAGSSHLFGVLPALMLATRIDGLAYLLSFGAGTVLVMTLFSWIVGLLGLRSANSSAAFYRGLMLACSALAVSVGAFWLVL